MSLFKRLTIAHCSCLLIATSVCPGGESDGRFPLWEGGPVPASADAPLLAGVAFHLIQRRQPEIDGYNWLHGVAVVRHNGALYATFGHNKGSENTATEVANGRKSVDGGKTWGPLFTIDDGPERDLAVSHGVLLSLEGKLWAFHGGFCGRMQNVHTRAYVLDDKTGRWAPRGVVAQDGFWPMQEPQRMDDGNWIMAGISVAEGYGGPNDPAAVAISHGNDSYPYAAEYDGRLYVVYSNDVARGGNRNSAELAVIPVESLRAD